MMENKAERTELAEINKGPQQFGMNYCIRCSWNNDINVPRTYDSTPAILRNGAQLKDIFPTVSSNISAL